MPRDPVEFTRQMPGGISQRVGNRVQIEGADGTVIGSKSPFPVGVVVPTAPYHGVVTVASAGTAVALSATSQALQAGVQVRAHIGNTGLIYVGGDTVAAANGYRLAQGESVFLSIADLADVYVDAAEDGDAVSFLAS